VLFELECRAGHTISCASIFSRAVVKFCSLYTPMVLVPHCLGL
jgi:hypothetical protein